MVILVGLGFILIAPVLLEYEWSNLEVAKGLNSPVTDVEGPAIYLFFTLALAIIYKKIPNLPLAWRDVLLAAFIVAGLVVFGIRQDDVLAATFLFGYLCVAAYWALGRREG